MILDLRGKTVTESVNRMRAALTDCADPTLEIRTDNEAVKLNLYNAAHRLGYNCELARDKGTHVLTIPIGSGKQAAPTASAPAGVATDRKTQTAFPVGHVTGDETPAPKRPPRRRRMLDQNDPAQPAPQARTKSQPKPEPQAQAPAHPAVTTTADLSQEPERVVFGQSRVAEPKTPPQADSLRHRRGKWLILQSDQVGNRDTRLGFELLEDLLTHIDTRQYLGIFLVHRGVMLLDPSNHGGRGLRILLRKNLPILACQKSVAYYNLEDKVLKPVKAAPFHKVMDLSEKHRLVWI